MRKNLARLFALPVALALAACAGRPVTGPSNPDAVGVPLLTAHGAWRVVSVHDGKGQPLPPTDANYRLQFVGQEITIHGGCNRMFSRYRVDRDMLRIEPLASTRMACAHELMAMDTAIGDLLSPKPLTLAIAGTQPLLLTLTTAAGDVLLLAAMAQQ
ncbi:MAG: META domain-containing protein [Pseudomonadota bacterium]|nr:META domain-containing protein [Pseudomonadota bacterium]